MIIIFISYTYRSIQYLHYFTFTKCEIYQYILIKNKIVIIYKNYFIAFFKGESITKKESFYNNLKIT